MTVKYPQCTGPVSNIFLEITKTRFLLAFAKTNIMCDRKETATNLAKSWNNIEIVQYLNILEDNKQQRIYTGHSIPLSWPPPPPQSISAYNVLVYPSLPLPLPWPPHLPQLHQKSITARDKIMYYYYIL